VGGCHFIGSPDFVGILAQVLKVQFSAWLWDREGNLRTVYKGDRCTNFLNDSGKKLDRCTNFLDGSGKKSDRRTTFLLDSGKKLDRCTNFLHRSGKKGDRCTNFLHVPIKKLDRCTTFLHGLGKKRDRSTTFLDYPRKSSLAAWFRGFFIDKNHPFQRNPIQIYFLKI
jgi:hypothetical protein